MMILYKIYRDAEDKLTLEGSNKGVVFTVTANSELGAKELLAQLQKFEDREGLKIDEV